MSIKKIDGKQGRAYRVRVDLGYDPVSGKRRQRMRTVSTKEEAKALERNWLTQIKSGTVVDTTKMVVRDLADHWLATMERRRTLAPTTLEGYRYTVEKYLLPALGGVGVQRLTVAHVQACYDDLASHSETARKAHLRLKQMLDHARRQQWVVRNVTDDVNVPVSKPRERATWTVEEVKNFLAAAERPRDDARSGDGYNPLWRLAISTGMRRGELLGLRWRDVDMTKGTIAVCQSVVSLSGKPHIKDVKTAASRRNIQLPSDTVVALNEHRERQNAERQATGPLWEDHNLVFATPGGAPLDPNNVKRPFAAIIKRAGIRPIPFHGLRHTHATLLIAEGVNIKVVSERLGHASIEITLRIYAHMLPGMQESAVTALDSLFGN